MTGVVVSSFLWRTEAVSAAGGVLWLSKSDNESSLINYVVIAADRNCLRRRLARPDLYPRSDVNNSAN